MMRIGLLFLLLVAGPLRAEQPAKLDNETFKDVAGELRCPTCTGLSVLDSEAAFSVQIKEEVKHQLEQGQDKATILKFFTQRYGPWILRSPPAEGFHAIAWWLPISLLLLGPIFIWFFIWRRRTEIASFGVRPAEEIVAEMKLRIETLKTKPSKEVT